MLGLDASLGSLVFSWRFGLFFLSLARSDRVVSDPPFLCESAGDGTARRIPAYPGGGGFPRRLAKPAGELGAEGQDHRVPPPGQQLPPLSTERPGGHSPANHEATAGGWRAEAETTS